MATPDGRYVLTYNGEVYNFQELRLELQALGASFRSRSDTEVVLYSLAYWGRDALLRFNGMFAFALWDRAPAKLLLARDRYGIKPLYYVQLGDTFLFGSEIKALLAHPAYRVELDREALLEYFTFQNFFTDQTLFRGVSLLPAGALMRDRRSTATASAARRRFWDFDFREPAEPSSEPEYLEELDRLFRQAVNRQLVADVPVGSYLSGGMDSGSITALAAAQIEWLHTFTVGFDLSSASGLELGVRRARARPSTCRTCSRPSTTRWCSRPATWSACCRGSSGTSRSRASGRATRTSTPRSWPASS